MKTTTFLTAALMALTLSMNTAFAQSEPPTEGAARAERVRKAERTARPERRPMAEGQRAERKQLTEEQRTELQVRRMQQRLLLDDATAAKFSPLYTEYLNALNECRKDGLMQKGRPARKEMKQPDTDRSAATPQAEPTDQEIRQRIEARIQAQRKRADIQANYLDKFAKLLTARQLEIVFSPQMHQGKGKQQHLRPGRHAQQPVAHPAPAPKPQQKG